MLNSFKMKILHVSNFGDRHNGRLYWDQCYKISNGFIRNGLMFIILVSEINQDQIY